MHPTTTTDALDKRELLSTAIEWDTEKLLAGIRTYVWKFGLARDPETAGTLAREILHDAFITVIKNSDRYDPAYPAYPWVLQTALNHIRNLLRKQGREVLITDEACRRGADPELSEEELLGALMRPAGGVSADGPTAEELLALVGGKDREALELHYLQGWEYPELAAHFQVSQAAARQRVSRAARHVREAYRARQRFAEGDD